MRVVKGLAVLLWLVSEGTATLNARRDAMPSSAVTLVVTVTGVADLPSRVRAQMADAVRRTWAPSGIDIVGLEVPAAESATLRIDLDTTPGHIAPRAASPPHGLARFVRSANRVIVSLPTAQETVLLGLAHRPSAMPNAMWHLALGDVLGRAIAHEIGHALLGPAHRRAGVMRAVFNPHEMVDPRSGLFDLDRLDAARLAARLPALRLPPAEISTCVPPSWPDNAHQ